MNRSSSGVRIVFGITRDTLMAITFKAQTRLGLDLSPISLIYALIWRIYDKPHF